MYEKLSTPNIVSLKVHFVLQIPVMIKFILAWDTSLDCSFLLNLEFKFQ